MNLEKLSLTKKKIESKVDDSLTISNYYNKYILSKINEKILYLNESSNNKFESKNGFIFLKSKEYQLYKSLKKLNKLKQKDPTEYSDQIEILDNYVNNLLECDLKNAKTSYALDKSKYKRKMILTGDLLRTILIICMPIFVYQFFNAMYTVIDQIICAKISTTAQNAVHHYHK